MPILASLQELYSAYRDFHAQGWVEYTREHTEIPIFAVFVYLLVVFYVPGFIKEPIRMRTTFALWNLLLAVFSIAGASVMVPHLVARVWSHGILSSICTDPLEWYLHGPAGFWTTIFIYSKIPELLDTAFLVVQGKPVIFLHWFHHLTVLLYCWHSYHNRVGPGIWFSAMNYAVHAVMYSYYFVSIIGYRKLAKPLAPLITTAQIAQMIGGTLVTITAARTHSEDPEACFTEPSNYKMGLGMYICYLVLFCMLFYNLYISRSGKHSLRKSGRNGSSSNNNNNESSEPCTSNDGAGFFHSSQGESEGSTPARDASPAAAGQPGKTAHTNGGARRRPARKDE